MTKISECQFCDFENALKRGRGHWVCPDCGRDISLEYIFWFEATHPDWDGVSLPKIEQAQKDQS